MASSADALAGDLGARLGRQCLEPAGEIAGHGVFQHRLHRLFAQRPDVGQAHAVGRQHAGQRVDQHPGHAEGVGDRAGVLAAGAAEAVEGVEGDVVAALHRDVLDGVGHVLDGDGEEAFRHLLRAERLAGGGRHLCGQGGEPATHHLGVERLVGVGPEHLREVRRLDARPA